MATLVQVLGVDRLQQTLHLLLHKLEANQFLFPFCVLELTLLVESKPGPICYVVAAARFWQIWGCQLQVSHLEGLHSSQVQILLLC